MNAPLLDDAPRKLPGRKDRRRWCKGHVGRPHEWSEWAPINDHYILCPSCRRIDERRCVNCGKKQLQWGEK